MTMINMIVRISLISNRYDQNVHTNYRQGIVSLDPHGSLRRTDAKWKHCEVSNIIDMRQLRLQLQTLKWHFQEICTCQNSLIIIH